jgi:hypothetical protein
MPLLAYYEGAYGPTIRIDVQSMDDLLVVRWLVARLATDVGFEAECSDALGLAREGIGALIVKSVKHAPSQALGLHYSTVDGPVFVWSNTMDGWQECLEKIQGLVDGNRSAHHYLTVEDKDDALVELCYRE